MGQIIKQTFRLYNTVGLIDKGKNIYYVPHQDVLYAEKTQTLTKVSEVYYKLFNTVCPFSSAYNNIEISQWSPEDRELKIEGLIDDFRQSRGLGLALNYIIIHREIYNVENNTETLVSSYYYAMFIDSVKQAGSRSVSLNLSPDYFTNFFYLNNQEELTPTYDPFNDSMVNCYVERQHYDRYNLLKREKIDTPVSFSSVTPQLNTQMELYKEYEITPFDPEIITSDTNTFGSSIQGFIVRKRNRDTNYLVQSYKGYNISMNFLTPNVIRLFTGIDTPSVDIECNNQNYYVTVERISDATISQSITPVLQSSFKNIVSFNLKGRPIRSTQEKILFGGESFRFKYQYRDERILLPLGTAEVDLDPIESKNMAERIRSVTSKAELNTLIDSLSSREKRLFYILITNYVVVQLSSPKVLFPLLSLGYYLNGDRYTELDGALFDGVAGDKHGSVITPFYTVVIPNVDNTLFPNINPDWILYGFSATYRGTGHTFTINRREREKINAFIGGTTGSQSHILSINFVKYNPLVRYYLEIDTATYQLDSYRRIVFNLGNITDLFTQIKDEVGSSSPSLNQNEVEKEIKDYPRYLTGNKIIPVSLPTVNNMDSSRDLPDMFSAKLNSDWSLDYWDYNFDYDGSLLNDTPLCIGFMFARVGYNYTRVLLDEEDITIDSFTEPLLDSNPYKFYSLSLYENEVPLRKERYYQSSTVIDSTRLIYRVRLDFIQSFTEVYKVGLVPSYTVNNVMTKYFSEALVMTLPAGIPIKSSAYYTYYYQNKAQMKNQYAVNDINLRYTEKDLMEQSATTLAKGFNNIIVGSLTRGKIGAIQGAGKLGNEFIDLGQSSISAYLQHAKTDEVISSTQQAKLADMGAKPNTVKLAGSDVVYEASLGEMGIYLNHYTIDTVSYNTIAKILERTGYKVDIMDSLQIFSRVGLNYVKLVSFDFIEDNYVLSTEQTSAIMEIFTAGVTLLHDKDYLHHLGESGYHNIEKALED